MDIDADNPLHLHALYEDPDALFRFLDRHVHWLRTAKQFISIHEIHKLLYCTQLRVFRKASFVYNFGDVNTNTYLILHGECDAYLRAKPQNYQTREKCKNKVISYVHQQINKTYFSPQKRRIFQTVQQPKSKLKLADIQTNVSFIVKELLRLDNALKTDYDRQTPIDDNDSDVELVRTLKQFQSFGEFGITSNHKRQSAVKCKTDVVAIEVSYEKYSKTGRLSSKIFQQACYFLRKIPLFEEMTNKLPNIALQECLEGVHLKYGDLLYEENEAAEHMYFIDQGEIQLSVLHDIDELKQMMQVSELSTNRNQDKRVIERIFKNKIVKILQEKESNKDNVKIRVLKDIQKDLKEEEEKQKIRFNSLKQKYEGIPQITLIRRVKKLNSITVSMLTDLQYFGYEELILQCNRLFTAKISSSEAYLYRINLKNLRLFEDELDSKTIFEKLSDHLITRLGNSEFVIEAKVKRVQEQFHNEDYSKYSILHGQRVRKQKVRWDDMQLTKEYFGSTYDCVKSYSVDDRPRGNLFRKQVKEKKSKISSILEINAEQFEETLKQYSARMRAEKYVDLQRYLNKERWDQVFGLPRRNRGKSQMRQEENSSFGEDSRVTQVTSQRQR